jgi:hypothetical protein
MMLRSTVFAILAACVAAKKVSVAQEGGMIPDFNIPTDSTTGKRLLSNARRLEQNNNNNQNQEEAQWLAGYSIKYDSCASLIQVREEGGGNDEEGLLYTQNLVKFVVCQGNSGKCNDCGKGIAQYVVNMGEFVEAYAEMKREQEEEACEMIREYCYCDNANDDEACENQCYADAGMSECIQYEEQEEMDVNAMLECQAMEGADGNNNNNNGNNGNNYNYGNNNYNNNGVDMYRQYYIGPYCSPKDGKSIFLGTFYDAGCTASAGNGVYEAFNYGYPLPYESESIVALNDCISCLQVDQNENENQNQNNNNNNNNNGQNYNYNNNGQNYNNNGQNNQNQNQEMEVAEICQQSYEQAAKCESKLGNYLGQYYYTDTSGCEYINNILPNLSHATKKISSGSSSPSGSPAATALAVVFGFTTLLLGAYAFFLYRKIHRAKVNLAQAEMGIA